VARQLGGMVMDLAALLHWLAVEARGGTANASSSSSGSVSPRCSKWRAAASSPPGRAASMVEVVSVVVCKCSAPGATGSFFPAICGGLLRLLDWT
jgi:hypothetical protein